MFIDRVDKMISVRLFEEMKAKYDKNLSKGDAWQKDNPGAHWIHNPYRQDSFNPKEWTPFDQNNIYFDECMAQVEKKIEKYNRIALIIQGLFDRSEVLHPHLPVKSWTHEGFQRAIKLVYDGTTTLYDGLTPDFEEYRAHCNSSLNNDSVVTGQEDYWLHKEAERENKRLDKDWRETNRYRHTKFQPFGNPGPGLIAKISQWKPRSREAVFSWYRERSHDSVRSTISVPESCLFNISAYKPGDYKQFFRDPRTREQYLQWAPLLLAAEDYCAGKIEAREPA